jgi:Phage integrase family
VAGPASRPGAAECGRRDVAGVAGHCETSDVGKRPRGVAELHRSEVRASAGGIDHYGGGLELAWRPDETGPCSVDGDASSSHPPISLVVCGGGRPSDGECCRGGESSDWGAGAARGRFLDLDEVVALAQACRGPYAELVYVLALQGLRWGELAGLQVGDRVMVSGPGLRLSRAVLASNGGGELYVDTLKNKRARTVPLVPVVVPIVDRWSAGKSPAEWLFAAPAGGALRETNWQRSVSWREAKVTIGRPELRVHDLRHTAASVWLASGADPKVVQRVLGHATAAMTMDLYGHMIDRNLWDAAQRLGGTTGARPDEGPDDAGGAMAKSRR